MSGGTGAGRQKEGNDEDGRTKIKRRVSKLYSPLWPQELL